MKESAYYQHIVNKAKAEGKAEGLAEGLLVLIQNRFTSVPKAISPPLSPGL